MHYAEFSYFPASVELRFKSDFEFCEIINLLLREHELFAQLENLISAAAATHFWSFFGATVVSIIFITTNKPLSLFFSWLIISIISSFPLPPRSSVNFLRIYFKSKQTNIKGWNLNSLHSSTMLLIRPLMVNLNHYKI